MSEDEAKDGETQAQKLLDIGPEGVRRKSSAEAGKTGHTD